MEGRDSSSSLKNVNCKNVEGMRGVRKSALGKHHSNNCCGQDPPTEVKINR